MDEDNEVKNVEASASPTSVLKEEDKVNGDTTDTDQNPIKIEADTLLVPQHLIGEEEKLLQARIEEENEKKKTEAVLHLDDSRFNKLDELLTHSTAVLRISAGENGRQFKSILFRYDTDGVKEDEPEGTIEKKKRRGAKRKATYNNKKAKRAVEAMLTRSEVGVKVEDTDLKEEEMVSKGLSELVPLLTGGNLKPYQLKGVKWLISLWQNGLNGILADQMGLGKTIQTIGFLAHLKGKRLDGPYLKIARLSTLSNWVNEIQRFKPSITVIVYHGNEKEKIELRRKYMPETVGHKFPLIVPSYEIAMNDARKVLRHYK